MSIAIAIATIVGFLLAFAIGYVAGWLDGNQRSVLLDDLPEWAKRPTTTTEDEA